MFIFGYGIVPSMGIADAALASLLAYSFEVVFYIVMVCRFPDKAYTFSFRDFAYIKRKNIKPFLRDTYPVILNA